MELMVRGVPEALRGAAFRSLLRLPPRLTRGVLHQAVVLSNSNDGLVAYNLSGVQSRNSLSLSQLAHSIASVRSLPQFAPILLWTGDRPVHGLRECNLAYCSSSTSTPYSIPVPDFVFTAWPEAGISSFRHVSEGIAVASRNPPETNRVGWRGNVRTAPIRTEIRNWASTHTDLLDFEDVDVASQGDRLRFMTMEEQARRFAGLLDVEGVGYSGRWKLQLAGSRPVVWIERPFVEYWFDQLPDSYKSLMVDRKLSNLRETLEFSLHSTKATDIQAEVREFAAEHFSVARIAQRWIDVLTQLPTEDRPYARAVWRVAKTILR